MINFLNKKQNSIQLNLNFVVSMDFYMYWRVDSSRSLFLLSENSFYYRLWHIYRRKSNGDRTNLRYK